MKNSQRLLLIAGSLLVCGALNAAEPPLTAEFYLPDYPAAAVAGSEATVRNPAALFINKPMGLLYLHSFVEGDLSGDNAFFVSSSGVGFAYQRFGLGYPNKVSRYDFAISSRVWRDLYSGISFTHFSTDWEALNKAHFWYYSLTYHLDRRLSLSAQIQNLNQNHFNGAASARGYSFSAALRPSGEKLTLGGDLRLYGGQSLREAEWRLSARAQVRRGLSIYAGIGNEQRFGLGLQMQFEDSFVGGEGFFDDQGEYDRATVYVGNSIARQPAFLLAPSKILHVDIAGDTPEQAGSSFLFQQAEPTVYTKLARIRAAQDDPSIKGILLTIRGSQLGWAKLADFRRALLDFRATGKPVICRLGSSPGNGSYYLASVADSIFMTPVAGLYLIGLRAEIEFYAGTLEKIGIEPQIEKMGKYKNAPNRYTETSLTPEHREAIEALLEDIYIELVTGIAAGRGISPGKIANLIDQGPLSAVQADSVGLIDDLLYEGEFQERLKAIFSPRTKRISINDYLNRPLFRERFGTPPQIALIGIEGALERSNSGSLWFGNRSAGAASIAQAVRQAGRSPNVKAIVLRLDTPGGDAIASDIIWGEVKAAGTRKPVVVSMSDACASGGYYIATAADRIFVEAATVTGSIGVYAGKADISGLHEKLGISTETITRGRFANMFSLTSPFSEEERQLLRYHLQTHYDHFLEIVAEGRDLQLDSVRVIAQGRVWSGLAALQNGLADEEGSVLAAVAAAAALADIGDDDYEVIEIPKSKWRLPLPGLAWFSLGELLPFDLPGLGSAAVSLSSPERLAPRFEMPFTISIF